MSIVGGDIIASLTGGLVKSSWIYSQASGTPIESNLGSRLFNRVETIINKYGTTAILYLGVGEYSAVAGKRTITEEITQTKKIIPPYPFRKELVNGDTIRIEDMQTGVAAKNLSVPIYDGLQVTVMSQIYTIERYWPIIANDTIVLYLMQLRK